MPRIAWHNYNVSNMKRLSFKDDYSEGAHPEILKLLGETNMRQTIAYGEDEYSNRARKLIKEKVQREEVDIHFVAGGTQANLLVIASVLKPYQSVIAAETAHIQVHETGAIEAGGHKINLIKTDDGKLKVEQIEEVLNSHLDEHMVQPKMVFISNSTEVGTIYSKKELTEISDFCKAKKLYLYMDGARLGSALSSEKNDLSLRDIARLLDVFYIGGTKNGALLGEAILICTDELKKDFRFMMKQKGALLAKSRIIGIQFIALFQDDLFFKLAQHANNAAQKIALGLREKGVEFYLEPAGNQLFPILPNRLIAALQKKYDFYIWSKFSENTSVVRIVCSWASEETAVNEFIADIQ